MIYKEILLRSKSADAAVTEIMYEIAACRADGVELIRFNISYGDDMESMNDGGKIISLLLRTLKNMKQKGSIQFIATPDSFKMGSTESSFLYNKYPSLFSTAPTCADGESFVFVKL